MLLTQQTNIRVALSQAVRLMHGHASRSNVSIASGASVRTKRTTQMDWPFLLEQRQEFTS